MTRPVRIEAEKLLTPGEVAILLHVDVKTVGRWAREGKLATIRTPGNQRRYKDAQVRKILATPGDVLAAAAEAGADGGASCG